MNPVHKLHTEQMMDRIAYRATTAPTAAGRGLLSFFFVCDNSKYIVRYRPYLVLESISTLKISLEPIGPQ